MLLGLRIIETSGKSMQEERYVVEYIAIKNCFVYLPELLNRRLDPKVNGLKLSHDKNDYYASWRPISGIEESLRISATFARILNIKEGDEVIVTSVLNTPYLSSVTVTPRSDEDWRIMEYQADRIQSVMLDQISLVAKSQSIVVWISKGLSVTLSIDALSPDFKYGRLGDRTEIHVELPKRPSSHKGLSTVDKVKHGIERFFGETLFAKMFEKNEINDNSSDIKSRMRNNSDFGIPEVFRVYSLSAMKEICSTDISDYPNKSIYDIFVHESDTPTYPNTLEDAKGRFFKIRKLREDRRYVDATSTDFLRTDHSAMPKQSVELVVRLFVIESQMKKNLYVDDKKISKIRNSIHKRIYVSTNLRRNLKLSVGSKVLLEPVPIPKRSVPSISIFPSSRSITKETFAEFLLNTAYGDEILLNSRSRIYFEDGASCMVLCSPEEFSHLLVDVVELQNIDISVNNLTSPDLDEPSANYEEVAEVESATISLLPFQSIIAECQIVLELGLGLDGVKNLRYEPGNLLLCGDVGVGKTTLCKTLRRIMQQSPHFVHVHTIECKSLKGKRAEAIHKIVSTSMADCIYHQPSILILDDLESITSTPSGEEEMTPDAINASRVLDVIFNISNESQSSHYVSIIATCTNINNLGPKLSSPRGVHLFRTVLRMPDLTEEHRIDILKLALRNHIHAPAAMNWDYYGNKTEGWVAQDLIDFAEKASFAAWKRHVKNRDNEPLALTEEDLTVTLNSYKTISLYGVQLYKSSNHDWSNVGGLVKVKQVLTQLLKWPMQYPELYRNAPIKNQNGVLLYGMPGTGKTILAGAISKECGVNLISVKGPELLSKYIGASEEAVRNVFDKARRAKPCVLFFDEFDSLAPRRGHDSTGVTDRVVNQLLTQLDGVEGREGVAVVAASSRPDLLDPALLRPGRLDKSLLCPLPDENDREAILKVLCKAQRIDTKSLDLINLAKRSIGFTGADLNAVLTQAKYDALESALSNMIPEQSGTIDTIDITQEGLIDSLNSTSPSLSTAEKEKYRRIYDRFSRGSNVLENDALVKQKVNKEGGSDVSRLPPAI